jgi:hypothetical protein
MDHPKTQPVIRQKSHAGCAFTKSTPFLVPHFKNQPAKNAGPYGPAFETPYL